MKTIAIKGTLRPENELGTKFSKHLRHEGLVPCVIYGGGKAIHFYAPELDFRHLVYTAEFKVAEIELDGQVTRAVMQAIQFHPVTDKLNHIDFIELVPGKPVKVEVPINLIGTARGVRSGGKQKNSLRTLTIRAVGENLPESIDINIEDLRIGQTVKVSDVKAKGFEIVNSPSAVIVSIKMSRNVVAEVAEEESAEAAPAEAAAE
jgi:large subunit ribosomal protein L25